MSRRLEHPDCNLCGSPDARLLYRSRDFRLRVDDEEYGVVRCTRCGLGYLRPRPDPEGIARYYPDSYYDGRDVDAAGDRMAAQAEYLGFAPPGRMLDVGAARGDFLRFMKARGWDVIGLDPYAPEERPGDVRIVRSWDDPELGDGFDAITAWSVFEHLHDPLSYFERARAKLRPGGRLIIHVPNLRSLRSRWAYLEDVPRHLYFFSRPTLRAYGERVGLPLKQVHHDTRVMDGGAPGVLRLHAFRLAGGDAAEFMRWAQVDRATRRREHPVLYTLGAPLAALERVVSAPVVRRMLRVNGYVVAVYEREA
ncbi:MAG TPA: class I SAM-dependent methyltransferase [Solirubrobacteraceae bacterium]|nr:class I SAM-dependent methyltransferase [Solirubrobacteraceae bacterium]